MMKIEIKEKKENQLLKRIRAEGIVYYEKETPSNESLKEALAAELKADKGLIVIKYIYPKFSHQQAEFKAVAYLNKEAMGLVEVPTKHQRKKLEEEKKKAEESRKKELEAKKAAEEKKEGE